MELEQFVKLVLRKLWFIVLIGALAGMVTFLVSQSITPTYQTSTTLLVHQATARGSEAGANPLFARENLLQTVAELLHKRPVFEGVIANLKLDMTPGALMEMITVTIIRDTQLVVVTVEDSDPQRGADIANEMIRVFSEQIQNVFKPRLQQADVFKVVEVAQPATNPSRPKPLVFAILGSLIGILLAIGGVVLVENLDRSAKSEQDVEQLLGVQTLGAIGRVEFSDPAAGLVTVKDTRSVTAEAYRKLAAIIDYISEKEPTHTITVASSVPCEGKSTILANLAVTLAQSGKRVILVDADLRRPQLHRFFNNANTQGLATALTRANIPIGDLIVSTDIAKLWLLPSGPLPSNPVELFGSPCFPQLINELQAQSDLVLFDSPPVQYFADAMLLAKMCDATMFVVLAGKTRPDVICKTKNQLIRSGARLLGVVLNSAPLPHNDYDAYYRQDRAAEKKARSMNGHRWKIFHRKNGNAPHNSGGTMTRLDQDSKKNNVPAVTLGDVEKS